MKSARQVAVLVASALAQPAAAHHPMGGTTPSSLVEGLLSGLGHPIIGVDHLLFILAVGVAAFYFGQRALMVVALLAGALVGTLAHVQWPGLQYHDVPVALSLVRLGVLMIRRDAFLHSPAAALLFALSGVAHGYAYGEAIVGAETTPLAAYLVGFTFIQCALALGTFMLVNHFGARKPRFDVLRATGVTLAAAGAGFLIFATLPQA
jgi:urease accessory protein